MQSNMGSDLESLRKAIEHTLLKPEATSAQIQKLCQEALDHHFGGVCVNGRFVELVKSHLKSSSTKIVVVIGFPLGAMHTKVKVFETELALQQGADEIDMVLSLGALKEKNYLYVKEDIQAVVKAAQGHPVKVILETHLLTEEEKIKACQLAVEAKAHFVKTSTGFTGGGATLEDIRLMRKTVGPQFGVKASGGVKTQEQALEFLKAGAQRLGTSSGVALVTNIQAQSTY